MVSEAPFLQGDNSLFKILRQSCRDASHAYVRTMMYVRTCAAVPLLPKMLNSEAVRIFGRLLQKKHSATSEEAYRNIGRSLPHHPKKPSDLLKKPSNLLKKPSNLLKKPSDLRRSCAANASPEKTFRRAASFLKTCTVIGQQVSVTTRPSGTIEQYTRKNLSIMCLPTQGPYRA